METNTKNANIKYFCCEDKIIVRVVEEENSYVDTLEYYDPKFGGWIPSREWYNYMFVEKIVNFREISKNDATIYINSSVEYFKRMVANPIYLRRIYGLDLEYFNSKTNEWQAVTNHDWYEKIDEYEHVTKKEVDNYIDNLFAKKMIR